MVTNQTRPIDAVLLNDGAGPERYPIEPPQNYNVFTPQDYWREGAPWPPKGTEQRARQLALYRELYDGNFGGLLGDAYPLRVNWFRRMSGHLADIMLAYPPVVSGTSSEVKLRQLNEQVADATYQVVLDQTRYGVGLFRARRDGDGLPIVEAVNPEFWYPAADADVFAIPQYQQPDDKRVLVERHNHIGQYRRREYKLSDTDASEMAEGQTSGGNLGALASEELPPTVLGRAVWPVPRLPANGEYGQSLYQDMIPLVAEHCRRLSKQSEVLNRHADPLLMLKRDSRMPYNDAAPGEDAEIRLVSERVFLDRWRQAALAVLPDEYEDARYISWDAQMQASFNHLANVERTLYATTQIPASLYGTLTGEVTAVGNVSLKKAYAPTFAFTLRLQGQITRALKGVCRAALGREVEVEWPNAIEEFDRQVMVNLGGDVNEEAEEPEPTSTTAMGFEVPLERD